MNNPTLEFGDSPVDRRKNRHKRPTSDDHYTLARKLDSLGNRMGELERTIQEIANAHYDLRENITSMLNYNTSALNQVRVIIEEKRNHEIMNSYWLGFLTIAFFLLAAGLIIIGSAK